MVVLYTALPLSFCAALGAALPQFAAGDVDATTGITPTIIVPPSFQQEDVKNIQDAPNWALKNVTRGALTLTLIHMLAEEPSWQRWI